ncbi:MULTISPECIES: DnaJ domain-containing protein [Undibacterium]|jgi:DnaJ-class molecular chaperone|uniref:DnaJ domain-containing protein n=2 Tax=Undibacterium TaxID=401469 RepID=A0A923KZN4_9BURK|nr:MULTISPECIES: DnaJ domain-containing protein [Undibacterium]MBC3930546.1 DnaJ domain-containing protein [Undibacterium curvum]MBC3935406.1 DnaJ domain-containing protein [Undibacterium rugosum]MBR7778819.1 DnaJ domain-containing protein [Undibacterium rugosum]NDI84499.1 DnaJ domain-containing protein [Undibacterium crateris]
MTDHYLVLGVAPNATLADIKKAYRQKAAEFHPDRNDSELAPAKFHAVKEAYDVLTDDSKRAAYDENRRRNLLDSPLETASEIWKAYLSGVLQ